MHSSEDIDSIVLSDEPVQWILSELIKLNKARDEKYSHSYVARRAKIANRSNLNEMLQGKRKIPKKYRSALLDAVGLKGLSKAYLLARLEAESEVPRDSELDEEARLLRKALGTRLVERRSPISMEALKLFSILGLLPRRGVRKGRVPAILMSDLRERIAGWPPQEISHYLSQLVELGAITIESDTIDFTNSDILIDGVGAEELDRSIMLAKRFVEDAIDQMDANFARDDAIYISFSVSVDSSKLDVELQRLRDAIHRFQAAVNCDEADSLLSVNVQVFPLDLSKPR